MLLGRPHYELLHPMLDWVFPTIKGTGVGKSNLKTAVDLENLTVDVYVQLRQVLSPWKSAAHDSLTHNNSLDISPSVKQGDWILLNRRTCVRNVNIHLMGAIIQMRFKSYHLRSIWRSGSYQTWYVLYMCSASSTWPGTLKASCNCVIGYTWFFHSCQMIPCVVTDQ